MSKIFHYILKEKDDLIRDKKINIVLKNLASQTTKAFILPDKKLDYNDNLKKNQQTSADNNKLYTKIL